MAHKLTHLSAVELARLVRTKKASPVEVVEAHLAAIERINPAVNAFCTVAAEKALAWAREAERAVKKRAKLKPLHGVPVAIKDLTLTADIRTTFGSTLFRDHVPTEDAEVVRRLKAAGAIVLGKTNTPEFGAGGNTVNKVFGATRNPWNTALSASGSTGGGAAALSARMAPLAEGSDFAGSLRTPAAFCGVVGLRTTAGLVPKHPAAMPWHDQSVAGPMARSAEDCALLGEAMVGNHLDRLERIGELGDNLAGNIRAGLALTISEIARAERKRAEIWHRWRALFERYDALLTPTTPVAPFPVEKNYPEVVEGRRMQHYIDWIGPTFLVSLSPLPSASVPPGLTAARLPVGLQIVGPRISEPMILTVAKFAEEAHPIGLPPNCA